MEAEGRLSEPQASGAVGGEVLQIPNKFPECWRRPDQFSRPPSPTRYIVLAGIRDTDPLEQELIDRSEIERISVEDIRNLSQNLHRQMRRLSQLTDLIYIHVDMDVLDPREVAGHPLTVPDGPTSLELAAALREMFKPA